MQAARAFKLILIGLLLVPGLGKQSEAQARHEYSKKVKAEKTDIPSTSKKPEKTKSPDNATGTNDANAEIISLLAYYPHKISSKLLKTISSKTIESGNNDEINKLTALMLFTLGEHGEFTKINRKLQMTAKATSNEGVILEKLMSTAHFFLNGDFGASERKLYSAITYFLNTSFSDITKKLAYGKVVTEMMEGFIETEWINSLRQRLLEEALSGSPRTCEIENAIRVQLRDALIDQIRYLDPEQEQEILGSLTRMNKKCNYNKLFARTQDALTDALLDASKTDNATEAIIGKMARVGHELLRINIIEDPNAISMKSLLNTNGLLLADKSYYGNYLGHLIITDEKAERLFRESKGADIGAALNKLFIARSAVTIAHDDEYYYSDRDKRKALQLAREAFNELIHAGKQHKNNVQIAWELSDYLIDSVAYLEEDEIEQVTDLSAEYISEVKQPSIVMAVLLDSVYLGYIASGNFSKAIEYGSWMQRLHLKGWRTTGLGLPNAGESITPEGIEYTSRSGSHSFLLSQIKNSSRIPSQFLYEEAMKMVLRDVLNLKGISIDILKKKRQAVNSTFFNNAERRILTEGAEELTKRPFTKNNFTSYLNHRLREVRLREIISSSNTDISQIDISRIASKLEPSEILVEYIELLGEYLIITLRRDGEIFITTAGSKEEVDDLINSVLGSLSEVGHRKGDKELETLAKRIFSPIEDQLLSSKIVYISPDSSLNKVPFHLLIDSYQQYIPNMSTARLITSGRDLLHLKNEMPSETNGEPVVIANPDFNYGARNKKSHNTINKQRWPALPGTQKEGKAIASLLNTTYIGEEAAKKDFVESVVSPSVLHIATHAFYNGEAENSKINSGMVFAGANILPDEESIMSPEEISLLDLNGTRLTVLSACETGIGEVLEGGSMASVQRAFTIAGTRSVINTLWKVDDYSSMAFMKELYRHLIEGKSLEQSMALTRNYFKNHPIPAWRAPYYWAAFQLYGDWRPIFLQ